MNAVDMQPGLITRAKTARGIVVWAYAVSSTPVCKSPQLMPMPASGMGLRPLDAHAEAAWILRQVRMLPNQTLRLMVAANYGDDKAAEHLALSWLRDGCQTEIERVLMPFAFSEYCRRGKQSERELALATGLSQYIIAREYGRVCGTVFGYDAMAMQILAQMFQARGWMLPKAD